MNNIITKLTNYTVGITKNKDVADDLVSDVLLSFLEAYPDKDIEAESSHPLLFTMCKNACIDRGRKKKEVCFSDLEVEDENGEYMTYEPAGTYGDVNYDDVEMLINSLPNKIRQACTLVLLQGFSNKEAAKELGIGLSALESRIHKGKKLIKKELED